MKNVLLSLLFISCSTLNARNLPLDTVGSVDLHQYLGKWYEIARFEQKFQKDCEAVTATYSLRKKGGINVINTCRKNSVYGELKTAKARAWVEDKETNAKLKVQFFLTGLKLPIFAGNYWILELAQDYSYAIVGDPSRKFLWILSRESKMNEALYLDLVARAKDMHFDVSKLRKTKH